MPTKPEQGEPDKAFYNKGDDALFEVFGRIEFIEVRVSPCHAASQIHWHTHRQSIKKLSLRTSDEEKSAISMPITHRAA